MAKEEKKEKKVAPKTIEELIEKLNKDYGKGTIFQPNREQIGKYDVIPTGSIGIDYFALGIGGFAKGKTYEIRGWEGSNKTTLCGHLCANAQKKGNKVLFIDGEHALDAQYFTQLGVDMENIMISQPDYGEAGFEIAEQMMKGKFVDLVIIDSDSSLIPQVVIQGEIGDSKIGKKARLNSDAYPKLKNAAHDNNVCLVVTSQYREKIGVMFGDPRVTQGGHALKYTADCIIEVTKTLKKEDDETCGTITTFKTLKNKTYVPFKIHKFETVFGRGIDVETETINAAIDLNLISKQGNTYFLNGEKLGVGQDNMKDCLMQQPEAIEKLKQSIIETLSKKIEKTETLEEIINE